MSNRTYPPSPIPLPDESERDSMSSSKTKKGLTREEVIRRRHRLLTQLEKFYKEDYWALMAEVRKKYREYLWKYGSPFVDERDDNGDDEEVMAIACATVNCKSKAMAMTRFCNSHILSDSKQMLYKGCTSAIKRGSTGPILCARPILRSAAPSLCSIHIQKSEKEVAKSLKKAGLHAHYSNKMAPMFHVLSTEFAKEILRKRRTFREDKDGDRDAN